MLYIVFIYVLNVVNVSNQKIQNISLKANQHFLAVTDLLVLSVLGRESVCRFDCSEEVTPIVAPPRAIWLPANTDHCKQTAPS